MVTSELMIPGMGDVDDQVVSTRLLGAAEATPTVDNTRTAAMQPVIDDTIRERRWLNAELISER